MLVYQRVSEVVQHQGSDVFAKMTSKQLNLGVEAKTLGSSFQTVHVFKK
jgi:hypothetical protein